MIITGGRPLQGRIAIAGSKNAALPLMAASLLTGEPVVLRNIPAIADTEVMRALLAAMGCDATNLGQGVIRIQAPESIRSRLPVELGRQMRASIVLLGPLLARTGEAVLPRPGGDDIGLRRFEQHLAGLRRMGAEITETEDAIIARAPQGLHGAKVYFDNPTVTGTENMLMAATLARGRTDILNAAREPHVQDLARALQAMGARIEGAGTDEIIVDGVDQLGGVEHSVVADYLEAGTYAIAVAAVGGDVVLENAPSDQLPAVLMKLDEAGAMIEVSGTELRVSRPSEVPLRSVDLTTWVHPGFPTDLQAQYLALMSQADGRSVISEFIFENRFQHVPDLIRMGARIVVHGRTVTVFGPCRLEGTDVRAGDIRSGAALVIAALCATGTTTLREAWHVDRGYEDMPGKLLSLGAMIERGAQPQASARAATGTYE